MIAAFHPASSATCAGQPLQQNVSRTRACGRRARTDQRPCWTRFELTDSIGNKLFETISITLVCSPPPTASPAATLTPALRRCATIASRLVSKRVSNTTTTRPTHSLFAACTEHPEKYAAVHTSAACQFLTLCCCAQVHSQAGAQVEPAAADTRAPLTHSRVAGGDAALAVLAEDVRRVEPRHTTHAHMHMCLSVRREVVRSLLVNATSPHRRPSAS